MFPDEFEFLDDSVGDWPEAGRSFDRGRKHRGLPFVRFAPAPGASDGIASNPLSMEDKLIHTPGYAINPAAVTHFRFNKDGSVVIHVGPDAITVPSGPEAAKLRKDFGPPAPTEAEKKADAASRVVDIDALARNADNADAEARATVGQASQAETAATAKEAHDRLEDAKAAKALADKK
jgi:hypothetical protein